VQIVNELAVGGLLPDLVVVLMLDTRTGLSRQGDPDRIGGESDDFHQSVLDGYRDLAAAEPDRVKLIAVADPPGAVAEQILKLIDEARG
jgi:dTMP kinase